MGGPEVLLVAIIVLVVVFLVLAIVRMLRR